jgi:hypothetical protein
MPNTIHPQTIVADSREAYERLVEDETVEIKFPSQVAEDAYAKRHWRFHSSICDVMGVTDGYERADRLVYFSGDWWPTQREHFAVDATAFGQEQVKALRALLQGEFADWKITVEIYRDWATNEPEHIGGLCIYAMRTLVQRDALQFVEWSSPRLRGA